MPLLILLPLCTTMLAKTLVVAHEVGNATINVEAINPILVMDVHLTTILSLSRPPAIIVRVEDIPQDNVQVQNTTITTILTLNQHPTTLHLLLHPPTVDR